MGIIKRLSPELVKQIAAGEVVERPASAIKELIDNSIDALANKIQVQVLSNDGRSFRVTDNGLGILPDDIESAFELHSTSKISTIEDLNSIKTKGFRGEALAGIASVSDLICQTRHQSENTATKAYFDEHGKIIKEPTALESGTSIEVFELFKKVPARLKFLKKPATELQAIQETVKALAIAHPEISFNLKILDREVFMTTGSGNWDITIKEVLGNEIPFKYLRIENEEEKLELTGFIAPLSYSRSDSNSIITLVNQRPIQCQILRKAVRDVYSGMLPKNKYPLVILNLRISPEQVDVNVHPTKKEVRYEDSGKIYLLTKRSIEKHLILNSGALSSDSSSSLKSEEKIKIEIENIIDENKLKLDSEETDVQIEKKPENTTAFNNLKLISRPIKERISEDNSDLYLNVSSLKFTMDREGKAQNYRIENSSSTNFCLKNEEFCLYGEFSSTEKILRDSLMSVLNQWMEENLPKFKKLEKELKESQKESQKESEGRSEEQGKFLDLPESKRKSKATGTHRKRISIETLEEIWQRDGWRCVYCGKYVLHPSLIKAALRAASVSPADWISKLTKDNKLIKIHVLREHQATHDHRIPVSKLKSSAVNTKENLCTCCKACNSEKNASTDYSRWQIKRFKPWEKGEKKRIGRFEFLGATSSSEFKILSEL